MMKKELKKKLESICDEIGTAAAAEKIDEMVGQISSEFDKKVADGQSELDAYRELLADVEKIKAMLAEFTETDEEADGKERK